MTTVTEPTSPPLSVREKRERRAAFMGRLYELTDGSPLGRVNSRVIGSAFGWDENESSEVAQYVVAEYLAEWQAYGGGIGITHQGVVEVEQWLESPDEPTEHFEPVANVTVHVHGDNHGQIQAGTTGSTQSMQTSADEAAIREFVAELRAALQHSPSAEANLAEASLTVIEGELAKGEARSSLVERLLPSLRDFAIGIASGGAYEGLHAAVAALPTF